MMIARAIAILCRETNKTICQWTDQGINEIWSHHHQADRKVLSNRNTMAPKSFKLGYSTKPFNDPIGYDIKYCRFERPTDPPTRCPCFSGTLCFPYAPHACCCPVHRFLFRCRIAWHYEGVDLADSRTMLARLGLDRALAHLLLSSRELHTIAAHIGRVFLGKALDELEPTRNNMAGGESILPSQPRKQKAGGNTLASFHPRVSDTSQGRIRCNVHARHFAVSFTLEPHAGRERGR